MNLPVIDRAGDWYAVAYPASTTGGYSTGWVNASNVRPTWKDTLPPAEFTTRYELNVFPFYDEHAKADQVASTEKRTLTERIFQKLADSAALFRQRWSNNAYMRVSGFSISLGVTPSMDIHMNFTD